MKMSKVWVLSTFYRDDRWCDYDPNVKAVYQDKDMALEAFKKECEKEIKRFDKDAEIEVEEYKGNYCCSIKEGECESFRMEIVFLESKTVKTKPVKSVVNFNEIANYLETLNQNEDEENEDE